MRICLDARLISGTTGGVEQAIIGLASGFSSLDDGDEEYLFLVYEGADAWIKPYLRGPCQVLTAGPPPNSLKVRLMRRHPLLRALWHRIISPMLGERSVGIPQSDGTIEQAGVDLMHFTIQTAFLTPIPSIFTPHDLQHLHLPSLFTPRERLKREKLYRTFCAQARMVVALTNWGKRDLITHYQLPDEKVVIVPWGSVLDTYPMPQESDLIAVQKEYSLPDRFLFYPAYSWPHKNHKGLLDALALLRDRDGLAVPVVFSGGQGVFFGALRQHVQKRQLDNQVRFVGFVSPLELMCLYRLCSGLIFPSLFEGWGLPILEAFASGVPVACSNVTSLPEVAGDAALMFDPHDIEQIAAAIAKLWQDSALRSTLISRGIRRVQAFSWQRTARLFRAHYRRLLGCPLTNGDIALLGSAGGD
ncbi:MAG: glycosyltransferase family 1 protein [Chloroflexota bacterium]|jgi:glycosyltransferase involved in cell wall biosynthesis